MVADYGYLRCSQTDASVPFIVIYVKPFRLYFATVVDVKGPDAALVKRISRWITEIGLMHYTYRSDREAALRALLRQAALQAGVPADQISEDVDPDSDAEETSIRPSGQPVTLFQRIWRHEVHFLTDVVHVDLHLFAA